MAKKRLAINLISNVISYSTTILVAFFLTPYLINTLGKDVYSFYPLANNFVNYMSIVTVALNSMASRFITIEIVNKNKNKANIYFVSVLFSNIIMSIFLFIIMAIIIIFLEQFLNVPLDMMNSIKLLFMFVFLSMIINVVTSVFGVAVFAKNRLDLRSLSDIIQGVLRVVLYIILFSLFKPNIIYVGIVAVLVSICNFGFHFVFTKKLLPDMKIKKKYFNLSAVKEILYSGSWNSLNQIGAILLGNISLLICNIYLGPAAAGDYSIVQTVPTFINGIISMLTAVFMPTIIKKYAEGDKAILVAEVKYSQKIMGLFTNIPIVVFMVVGSEFFSLWMPNQDTQKLQVLSLLTISHLIITGVTWPVSNLNTVMNKVKIPSLYLVGSGVANFALVIFFLNLTNMGIYSIPLASLIINLIWIGIFVPLYPCKTLNIKWNTFYLAVIKTCVGSVIILATTNIVKTLIPINNWISLFIVCIISGLIGLICNSLIVLKPYEIMKIKQRVFKELNKYIHRKI